MEPLIFEERWELITDLFLPNVIERYAISDLGKVINIKTKKIMKPQLDSNGYYRVNLGTKTGQFKFAAVHRLVAMAFIPTNTFELQVNHIDGNKTNNNVWNLEWVTRSQNILHAFRIGLITRDKGEDSYNSLITNEQAELICQLISEQKYTRKEIAKIVGCSESIVANISIGRTWKFISDKYNIKQYKRQIVHNIEYNEENIHKICKYFEDNKNKYNSKMDLFIALSYDLFGIIINDYHDIYKVSNLYRIYNRRYHRDISDQYDF